MNEERHRKRQIKGEKQKDLQRRREYIKVKTKEEKERESGRGRSVVRASISKCQPNFSPPIFSVGSHPLYMG